MYEAVCKELGFDCDFIIKDEDRNILAAVFMNHLQSGHKKIYQKKEIIGFIDTKNKKENNSKHVENKLACDDDCESFRLEKWNIGHRNFP